MIVLMTVDKEKNDVMNYAKNKTEIIVRSRKKRSNQRDIENSQLLIMLSVSLENN